MVKKKYNGIASTTRHTTHYYSVIQVINMRHRVLSLVLSHGASCTATPCSSSLPLPLPLLGAARQFAAKGDGVGRKNRTQDLIDALSPGKDDVTWTDEELADAAARAKEYSRQKMHEHRQWQKQFMTKVKLRDAAIAALPTEELRAAARTPDLTPFPSQRQVWTETPPHEQGAATRDDTKDDKRRRKIGTKM